MKIGLSAMFGTTAYRGMPFVRDYAATAEGIGFSSLWAPEHVVFFGEYKTPYPYKKGGNVPWNQAKEPAVFDPLLVIAAAAGVTTTLRFGTTVLVVPERPALLTAKEVMTLDHLTGGRFEFGVGLGWSAEEYAALGVPWERRGRRFDEYLEAIKAAWTQERATYHGEFVAFDDVILRPFPLTPGGPPILVGGNSAAAIRRAVRIGDGWYGVWMGFKDLEPKLAEVRECLVRAGREPEGFMMKLNLPIGADVPVDEVLHKVAEARRLGVHEFVLELPIRSRHLDADLRYWAELLEVGG
jgi:probable F420-dependent oxidoreductase